MEKPIIWVGLDVHAATIAIARLNGTSTTPITSEIPNDRKVIARVFRKLASEGQVNACYEAGPCGYELRRHLTELGINCVVIAPSLIPQKPGDRIKTDRRDAIKLARFFRAGELTAVWVPEPEQEAVRDLVRARDDARRDRSAARQRLGKFLLRHGRRFTDGKKGWTKKYMAWVSAQKFEHEMETFVFQQYLAHIYQLDARMKVLDAKVAEVAGTKPFAQRVQRLCALRGIAPLSAMVLISELFDLRRFENPRQLMAFVGIVPGEHSTGSKERRRGITKTGNTHVRRTLVEASWSYRKVVSSTRAEEALAQQPPEVAKIAREATTRLSKRYRALIAKGKRPQLAITAIARELCGFVWAMENAA
jgi:transposase